LNGDNASNGGGMLVVAIVGKLVVIISGVVPIVASLKAPPLANCGNNKKDL
jgi:uncharacterized membrane protein